MQRILMAAALRAPHKHHHGSAALKIQGGEAQSGQHDLNNGAWSLAERLPLGWDGARVPWWCHQAVDLSLSKFKVFPFEAEDPTHGHVPA